MRKEAIRGATSSKRQNYGTPWPLYLWLDWAFRFTVDAAAEAWNAKHPRFWSLQDNALAHRWTRERWYLNCEYRQVVRFTRHAKLQAILGGAGINTLACRPDTDWWRGMTENGLGRMIDSYFVPETRTWWTLWQDLIVGVHHLPGRVAFLLPPGTKDARTGEPKEEDPSFFPSSLVVLAARARHRLVELPKWPKPTPYPGLRWPRKPARTGWQAALAQLEEAERARLLDYARGWPPLTYGMPEP